MYIKKIFLILSIQLLFVCNISLQDAFSLSPSSQISNIQKIKKSENNFKNNSNPIKEDSFTNINIIDIIPRMIKFNPKEINIENLEKLSDLWNKGSQDKNFINRKQYYEDYVNVISKSQFARKESVRELIANGLDADANKIDISSSKTTNNIKIKDNGKGMDLKGIMLHLLSPISSSNDFILNNTQESNGKTGRFGEGFFSVLSWLETDNDSIIIETKQKNNQAYELILKKQEGKILTSLRKIAKQDIGTTITINSKSLDNNEIKKIDDEVVKKRFKFNRKGKIFLNNNQINNTKHFAKILMNENINENEEAILYSKTISNNEKGVLSLSVNGIVIEEFDIHGENILDQVNIDFPADTILTQDRSTMNFDNKNKLFMKQVLDKIFKIENKNIRYALLNSLYPCLRKEQFDLLNDIKTFIRESQNNDKILPLFKGSKHIEWDNNLKIYLVNPDYIKRISFLKEKSYYTSNYLDIFKVKIKKDAKQKAFILTDEKGKKIFIDESILVDDREKLEMNLHLLNQEIQLQPKDEDKVVIDINKILNKKFPRKKEIVEQKNSYDFDKTDYHNIEDYNEEWLNIFDELKRRHIIKHLSNIGSPSDESKKNLKLANIIYTKITLQYKNEIEEIGTYIHSFIAKISPYSQKKSINLKLMEQTSLTIINKISSKYTDKKKIKDCLSFFANILYNQIENDKKIIITEKKLDSWLEWFNELWSLSNFKNEKDNIIVNDHPYIHTSSYTKLKSLLDKNFLIFKNKQLLLEILNIYTIYNNNTLEKLFKLPNENILLFITTFNSYIKKEKIGTKNSYIKNEQIRTKILPYLLELYTSNSNKIDNILNPINKIDKKNSINLEELKPQLLKLLLTSLSYINDQSFSRGIIPSIWDSNGIKENIENKIFEFSEYILEKINKKDTVFLKNIDIEKINVALLNLIVDEINDDDKYNNWSDQNINTLGHIQVLEKNNKIPDDLRPYLYYILLGGEGMFKENTPKYTDLSDETSSLLHKDPDVSGQLGTFEIAEKKIIEASGQHNRNYMWVSELVKNAEEAGAKNIDFNVYKDENEKLIVEIIDNGCGMDKKTITSFYIPGLTAKDKDSDSRNYGWGAFTCFSYFDNIFVETCKENNNKTNLALLKKENGIEKKIKQGNRPSKTGTKIILQTNRESSIFDPVLIKSFLVKQCKYKNINITFNGEKINIERQCLNKSNIQHEEIYNKEKESIKIYFDNNGSVYWGKNKTYMSELKDEYLKLLPEKLKILLKGCKQKLAILLPAFMNQNMNRTGIIDKEKYMPSIQKAVLMGALKLILNERLDLLDMIPYDFWYDFKYDFDKKNIDDLIKNISDNRTLGHIFMNLPINGLDYTLLDLRNDIKKYLKSNNIINAFGNYNVTADFNKENFLRNLFFLDINKNIKEMFASKIETKIKNIKLMQADLKDKFNNLESTTKTSDFTLKNIPENIGKSLDNKDKLTMKILEQYIEKICSNKKLGYKKELYFYIAANNSDAHADKTDELIAINLLGSTFTGLKRLLTNNQLKEIPKTFIANFLELLTHEITHTKEGLHEQTHDSKFFSQQTKLFSNLYIKENDTDSVLTMWNTVLKSV